jgi:hypothetical protein
VPDLRDGARIAAAIAPAIFPPTFRSGDGSVPVYFEAAAVIMALVLLGQVLELRARSRTTSAIRVLLKLAPKTARLVQPDETEVDIPLEQIYPEFIGDQRNSISLRNSREEQPRADAPYERLLGDAMVGDGALFTREDTVEAAWAVVDPVLRRHGRARPYRRAIWGPRRPTRSSLKTVAGTTPSPTGLPSHVRRARPRLPGACESREGGERLLDGHERTCPSPRGLVTLPRYLRDLGCLVAATSMSRTSP